MGLVVSTVASCLTSCCVSCTCCLCCKACESLAGKDPEHDMRRGSTTIKYFVLFTLSLIAALVLRYQNDGVIHLYTISWDACTSSECVGYAAVYRITFALFLFFLAHAFLLLFSLFSRLDRISWFWHYVLFIGVLIGCWAIPSPFYDQAWINIARFLSFFFLFFSVVILIDFAYEWNESWTSDEKRWFIPVLLVSALMLAGCVVLWALYFVWFGGGGCGRNRFLISWTVVQCVVSVLLAISPVAEGNGGILPASVLSLYMTWLAYSALESDPSDCNSISNQDTLHLILGLIVGAAALIYAAWNVSTNNTLFGGEDAIPAAEGQADATVAASKAAGPGDIEMGNRAQVDVAAASGVAAPSVAAPSAAGLGVDENARLLARRNLRIHLLMAMASAYAAMLLTNWGSSQQAASGGGGTQQVYDQGTESLFIKFATQWLSFLVFIWSLIAPKVLKNREFRTR